ncbi:MAG: class I SAM-dependent methyltransferase, partial [Proteobacteria bacterium]|nr:class I SAM-dependent methyltransferase [Pseudomonadota bacterium]
QRAEKAKRKLRGLSKIYILRQLLHFLFCPAEKDTPSHQFRGDAFGHGRSLDDNRDYVQFHYDISNEFYQLFLDPEMQYSCAYFTDPGNTLEQAQRDKLDMICRKLALGPGDRFLDIGSSWGGLLCHAARAYGAKAHGVTLSRTQHDYTVEKVRREGLEGRVTVELGSYENLDGEDDKIASIGMYEHVGIGNYPAYFAKLNRLLRDRGLLLNHGLTRRVKRSRRRARRVVAEKRLLLKYIFPGSELDHIGHSLEAMEAEGFEIRDVESWREHYALTTRHWHRRLLANKESAIAEVGAEKVRIWLLYLAGASLALGDGALRIYQTVAVKHKAKGPSGLPPTRADLYAKPTPEG